MGLMHTPLIPHSTRPALSLSTLKYTLLSLVYIHSSEAARFSFPSLGTSNPLAIREGCTESSNQPQMVDIDRPHTVQLKAFITNHTQHQTPLPFDTIHLHQRTTQQTPLTEPPSDRPTFPSKPSRNHPLSPTERLDHPSSGTSTSPLPSLGPPALNQCIQLSQCSTFPFPVRINENVSAVSKTDLSDHRHFSLFGLRSTNQTIGRVVNFGRTAVTVGRLEIPVSTNRRTLTHWNYWYQQQRPWHPRLPNALKPLRQASTTHRRSTSYPRPTDGSRPLQTSHAARKI